MTIAIFIWTAIASICFGLTDYFGDQKKISLCFLIAGISAAIYSVYLFIRENIGKSDDSLTALNLTKSAPAAMQASIQSDAKPDPELDEQQCQILTILFQRTYLVIDDLESSLHMAYSRAVYHLEELRKAGYVSIERGQKKTLATRNLPPHSKRQRVCHKEGTRSTP
jgi:hypothetical protein